MDDLSFNLKLHVMKNCRLSKAINKGAFAAWLWVLVAAYPHYDVPNLSSGGLQHPQSQEQHSFFRTQALQFYIIFSCNTSLHVYTMLSTSSPNQEQHFLTVCSRDVGINAT